MTKWLHEADASKALPLIVDDIEAALSMTRTYGAPELHPWRRGQGLRIVNATVEAALDPADQGQLQDDADLTTPRAGATIPESAPWMMVFAHWIKDLDPADLTVSALPTIDPSPAGYWDTDYANKVAAVAGLNSSVPHPHIFGEPDTSFQLAQIEGTPGAVIANSTDHDYEQAGFFLKWDFPGNPYREGVISAADERAIKTRIIMGAGLRMICAIDNGAVDTTYVNVGIGTRFGTAAHFAIDVLPPLVRDAYETGLADLYKRYTDQTGGYQQADLDMLANGWLCLAVDAFSPKLYARNAGLRVPRVDDFYASAYRHAERVMRHDNGADAGYMGRGTNFNSQSIGMERLLAQTMLSEVAHANFLKMNNALACYFPCREVAGMKGKWGAPTNMQVGNHAGFVGWQASNHGQDILGAYYVPEMRARARHYPNGGSTSVPIANLHQHRRTFENSTVDTMNGNIGVQTRWTNDILNKVPGHASAGELWPHWLPADAYDVIYAAADDLPPSHPDAPNVLQVWAAPLEADDFACFLKSDRHYLFLWGGDQGSRASPSAGQGNDGAISVFGTPEMGPVVLAMTRGHQNPGSDGADRWYAVDSQGYYNRWDRWCTHHLYGTLANLAWDPENPPPATAAAPLGGLFSSGVTARNTTQNELTFDEVARTLVIEREGPLSPTMRSGIVVLNSGEAQLRRRVDIDDDRVVVEPSMHADATAQADPLNNLATLIEQVPFVSRTTFVFSSSIAPSIDYGTENIEWEAKLHGSGVWTGFSTNTRAVVDALRCWKNGQYVDLEIDPTQHPNGLPVYIETRYSRPVSRRHLAHLVQLDLHPNPGTPVSLPAETKGKYTIKAGPLQPRATPDVFRDEPSFFLAYTPADGTMLNKSCPRFDGTMSYPLSAGFEFQGNKTVLLYLKPDTAQTCVLLDATIDAANFARIGLTNGVPYWLEHVGGVPVVDIKGTTALDTTTFNRVALTKDEASPAGCKVWSNAGWEDPNDDTLGTPTTGVGPSTSGATTTLGGASYAGLMESLVIFQAAHGQDIQDWWMCGQHYRKSHSWRSTMLHWFPLNEYAADWGDAHGSGATWVGSAAAGADTGFVSRPAPVGAPLDTLFPRNDLGSTSTWMFRQHNGAINRQPLVTLLNGKLAADFAYGDFTSQNRHDESRSWLGWLRSLNGAVPEFTIACAGDFAVKGAAFSWGGRYSYGFNAATGGLLFTEGGVDVAREDGADQAGIPQYVVLRHRASDGWSFRRDGVDVPLTVNTPLVGNDYQQTYNNFGLNEGAGIYTEPMIYFTSYLEGQALTDLETYLAGRI